MNINTKKKVFIVLILNLPTGSCNSIPESVGNWSSILSSFSFLRSIFGKGRELCSAVIGDCIIASSL